MVMLICLHGSSGRPADWGSFPEEVAPTMRSHRLQGGIPSNDGHTFFTKLPDGTIDPAEIAARADALAAHIATFEPGAAPLLMGYSSGATIAAAILLRHPSASAGAVLLRPQPPFPDASFPPLGCPPALILAGRHDARRVPGAAETLARQLRSAGSDVEMHMLDTGHGLDPAGQDRQFAKAWLARFAAPAKDGNSQA